MLYRPLKPLFIAYMINLITVLAVIFHITLPKMWNCVD